MNHPILEASAWAVEESVRASSIDRAGKSDSGNLAGFPGCRWYRAGVAEGGGWGDLERVSNPKFEANRNGGILPAVCNYASLLCHFKARPCSSLGSRYAGGEWRDAQVLIFQDVAAISFSFLSLLAQEMQ